MKIAIIHHDTLTAVGMRYMLYNYFDVQAVCFATAEEFVRSHSEQYDGYFMTSVAFVSCMEVMMPRKSRVVLMADGNASCAWNGLVINTQQPMESIVDDIERVLRSIKQCNTTAEAQEELSVREVEVLRCVAKGMLNKEIAQELHISINTVLSHRKNIVNKLGIKTVSGLSLYAMMNGIIDAQ